MNVNELKGQTAQLIGLNNVNVIIGRNGAGKSRFLREIADTLSEVPSEFYVRYVSPERAGTFKQDGNVLTNMSNDPNWIRYTRAKNQVSDFKAASAMLFRDAETIYLRRLESDVQIRDDHARTFRNDRLSKINGLLTNISMEMGHSGFEFRSLTDGTVIAPDQISSGESEAVALAAEILYFFDTVQADKVNVLLLDEPDVHLHPDLQARLGKLILGMIDEFNEHGDRIAVCISTHSTPLISALANSSLVSIGTKNFGVPIVELQLANAELRKAAPFFGHPLSLALSQDAPLILEGEDDERIWQQAARTSQGRIKVFPVLATSVNQQGELENFCESLLGTLYDNPRAFSLRDGDGVVGETLKHKLSVKRYRLNCYAVENALLSDPCLEIMDTTWDGFITAAQAWIAVNSEHRDVARVQALIADPDRARHVKIKDIRTLVCAIVECKKPWEVVVGQAIARLKADDLESPNMLVDYLGADMLRDVVFREIV